MIDAIELVRAGSVQNQFEAKPLFDQAILPALNRRASYQAEQIPLKIEINLAVQQPDATQGEMKQKTDEVAHVD